MHHSFGNNKRRWCSVNRLCLRQELLWYNSALNACLVFAFLTFKEGKKQNNSHSGPSSAKKLMYSFDVDRDKCSPVPGCPDT